MPVCWQRLSRGLRNLRCEGRIQILTGCVEVGPIGHGHKLVRAQTFMNVHTTVAPSPTAEATRLIEPCRTPPAANTPGTLASHHFAAHADIQGLEAHWIE
jgi:hypothetical protein